MKQNSLIITQNSINFDNSWVPAHPNPTKFRMVIVMMHLPSREDGDENSDPIMNPNPSLQNTNNTKGMDLNQRAQFSMFQGIIHPSDIPSS